VPVAGEPRCSGHTARVSCRKRPRAKPLQPKSPTKIIAELEAGRIPWVQPWGGNGGNQGAARDAAQRVDAARIFRD